MTNSEILSVIETLKVNGFKEIHKVENLRFFDDIAWGEGKLIQSSIGTGFNAWDYVVTIWMSGNTAVFRVSSYAPYWDVIGFLMKNFDKRVAVTEKETEEINKCIERRQKVDATRAAAFTKFRSR